MKYKSLYCFKCSECGNSFKRKYTLDTIVQEGKRKEKPPEIYKDKNGKKKIVEIICKCGSKKVDLEERGKIVD